MRKPPYRGGFFIDPNQKETHEPNHREQHSRTYCNASGLEQERFSVKTQRRSS